MFGNFKMKYLLIVFIMFMYACSSPHTAIKRPANYINYYDTTKHPDCNKVYEAEVGEKLVTAAKSFIVPSIKLNNNRFENQIDWPYVLTFDNESLFLTGHNSTGKFYGSIKNIKIQWKTKNFKDAGKPLVKTGGIYVPHNSRRSTSLYWRYPDFPNRNIFHTFEVSTDTYPNIKFHESTPVVLPRRLPEDLSEKLSKIKDTVIREIIYQGKSKNTIVLKYREFINDTARPAFHETLRYDMSKHDIIGYEGARLKVIKATNTKIRYKVLKQLPFYSQEETPKGVE